MHIETGKILELRRKLDEEMNRISEDFISSNHLETESYLNVIKYLKNDYQDAIEDMVDMYREVLEKPEVLDEWTQEVKDIANIVKKHANVTRTKVLQLDAHFYSHKPTKTKAKVQMILSSGQVSSRKVDNTSWLKNILPVPRVTCPETGVSQRVESDCDEPAQPLNPKTVHVGQHQQVSGGDHGHKAVSDVDHQPVSGADYGNKGVSAGNQEPVIEADHGHKAVSDVDHQPVSEAVHHGHKAFIGEEHLGQKALSSVNLHHLSEGHHGHNAGVGHECTSLGLYQDSGGLEAVWQDLCQAAESSNNLCSQATGEYLDKGAMYQDSGGHGTTSQELNHASYDGIYLAAKAAHFLATIAKPVYVDSSQDLASDTVIVDDTHDIECHGKALGKAVLYKASDCEPNASIQGVFFQASGGVIVHSIAQGSPQGVQVEHGHQVQADKYFPVVPSAVEAGRGAHTESSQDGQVLHHYQEQVLLAIGAGQAVPGHAPPGHDEHGHAVTVIAEQNLSMKDAAMIASMQQEEIADMNNTVKELNSTSGMQLNKVRVNKLSTSERKQLVRAGIVMLMWKKFLARESQLILYLALADYSLGGCSVTLSVDDNNHCKCLNNNSRATSVKLKAANLLTSQLFVLAARATAGSI